MSVGLYLALVRYPLMCKSRENDEGILGWLIAHLWTVCLSEGSGSVKSGGGGNAREIRIRKTKKKGRKDEDSDEEIGTSQQSIVRAINRLYINKSFLSLCAHKVCSMRHFTVTRAVAGWFEISPLGCLELFLPWRTKVTVASLWD